MDAILVDMTPPTDADDFVRALGAQVRAEIAAAGTSARAVAETAGMQPVVLSRYLKGQRDMPISTFVRILNAIENIAGLKLDPRVVVARAEDRMIKPS